jgi:hypothetical protein
MAQHARDDGDVLDAVARQPGRQVVERHVGLLLDLQQLGREVVVLFVLLGTQLAPRTGTAAYRQPGRGAVG